MERGGDFLAELYRELEGWYEFISAEHTMSSLWAKQHKNNLALLVKTLSKEGLTDEDIELDDRVIALRKALQVRDQEAELWGQQKSALDRRMKLVSRSVGILQLDEEAARRASNIGNKPWPFRQRGD